LDERGFTSVYNMLGGMNVWPWETVPCNGGSGVYGVVEDINGDGKIGNVEAIYILQRVAELR
jgi:hypothetical protein